jgi:hypothetical protein
MAGRDRMRVLQGNGVGAVQDDPAEGTDAEFVDAGRAGGQDEMRQMRQAARATIPRGRATRRGLRQAFDAA